MATRKVVSAEASKEACDTGCWSCKRGFWWSVLRITLAVAIISGAYIAGVVCGVSRGNDWSDHDYDSYRGGKDMMMRHRGPMMQNNTPNNQMMTPMSHDPMSMSMMDMSKMLEGKTGDALDRAFLEGMIPHHQGAVDMAKYLVNAKHPELRKMGEDIIKAQTTEIEQMKKWMTTWGYASTGATQTGTMMHMMPDGTMMQGHM